MRSLSSTQIAGHLTADPVLKNGGTDKAYCYFTTAVNMDFGDNKHTDFYNCTAFKKDAENLYKYQKKGDLIGITGYMESYSKEGEEINGYPVIRWRLIAREIYFLSPKKDREGDPAPPPADNQRGVRANPPSNNYRRGAAPPPPKDMEETDEDMPF